MTPEQHTPGPWFVREGEDQCFHEGNRVAIVHEWQDPTAPDERGENTVAEVWRTGNDTDLLDGRLIATAPELLEALQAVLQWADPYALPDCDRNTADVERANAAIAKATGGAL